MHFATMPISFTFPQSMGALIGRPNVVFTPNIAFNSVESVKRINQTTVEDINAFLVGQPVNLGGYLRILACAPLK